MEERPRVHQWDSGEKTRVSASCSPTLHLHMHTHHGQHSSYARAMHWGELQGVS